MNNRTYGYIRVSSRDQNIDRQLIAMQRCHVPRKNIYVDKMSGKDSDRPGYQSLLKQLQEDDLVYIKSIDRLGRNYADIQEQWQLLTKKMGVDICVIDMPLLDTRNGKDLMGTFLADLVLQILSFVSQNERNMIRQRQAEGIAAAKARGVKLGRPSKPLPGNFMEVYQSWKKGRINKTQAAKLLKMPLSTFCYKEKMIDRMKE